MHVTIIEGLFHESGTGFLRVEDPSKAMVLVCPQLESDLGVPVHVVIHHVPKTPLDKSRWGGGCCHWQPAECPAGHHKDPGHLLHFDASGILQATSFYENGDPKRFALLQPDGQTVDLPLQGLLGHDARIILVVKGVGTEDQGDLINSAQKLQETLRSLQGFINPGKS